MFFTDDDLVTLVKHRLNYQIGLFDIRFGLADLVQPLLLPGLEHLQLVEIVFRRASSRLASLSQIPCDTRLVCSGQTNSVSNRSSISSSSRAIRACSAS